MYDRAFDVHVYYVIQDIYFHLLQKSLSDVYGKDVFPGMYFDYHNDSAFDVGVYFVV